MKIDEKYKLLSLKGTPQTVAEIAHEITKGGKHSIQDQLEIKMGNKTGDKRGRGGHSIPDKADTLRKH